MGGGSLQADGGDLGGAARRGQSVLGAHEIAIAPPRPRSSCAKSPSARSISACLSVPTLDEKAWRATEPHTPNPRARLEAVAELNRAGIPTGVLVAPLMPGINDAPEQLEPLLASAAEAGATSINGIALHLRGEVREVFMEWLCENRPGAGRRATRGSTEMAPTVSARNASGSRRWCVEAGRTAASPMGRAPRLARGISEPVRVGGSPEPARWACSPRRDRARRKAGLRATERPRGRRRRSAAAVLKVGRRVSGGVHAFGDALAAHQPRRLGEEVGRVTREGAAEADR